MYRKERLLQVTPLPTATLTPIPTPTTAPTPTPTTPTTAHVLGIEAEGKLELDGRPEGLNSYCRCRKEKQCCCLS